MSTLTIEGWRKASQDQKSTPIGEVHFYVDGNSHARLEQAEEQLQKTHAADIMIDVDEASLDLKLPAGYGPLSDCQFRVYLNHERDDKLADGRGQFHLVGHQASDGCLIYTNAVLIAQLG
jgi:hypothetical protein